jgi:UDP:flavonoid glycosyltransferase YjiC (YdhE family)
MILFARELPHGFGERLPLVDIAAPIAAVGGRCAFAVSDIAAAEYAGAATLLQAPVWPDNPAPPSGSSYGALLDRLGWADPDRVKAMVSAWDTFLRLLQPSSLVVEHSPALFLALATGTIPVVAVGTPYTLPPPGQGFARSGTSGERTERLLLATNALREARGLPPFRSMSELFPPKRIVVGLPDLDPHRAARTEPLAAPPGGFPEAADPPAEKRPLVWFDAPPKDLPALAQELATVDFRADIYVAGGPDHIAEFLRLRGHRVHRAPPDLRTLLPSISHVVGHAGTLLASMALAAGRPQLMMPRSVEQRINAAHLARLRVGITHDPESDSAAWRAAILAFLADPDLPDQALDRAGRIRAASAPDAAELAAKAVNG